MKKLIFFSTAILLVINSFAQWVPVNNGLDGYTPTAIWPFGEDMVIGTDGGGIYKSMDNGENWSSISGNIGNYYINDIMGHASLTSMFVATEGGPFYTLDQVNYEDCTSSGLSNTDTDFFVMGDDNIANDYMIGTNGGGVFTSIDYTGPWTSHSSGLLGGGLDANHFWHFDDNELSYFVLATENGVYFATESNPTWEENNSGLSGSALHAKRITGLGTFALLATHGGLFYNLDMGNEWFSLIPDEKLNSVIIVMSSASSTGFMCLAFGENGFYSEDFLNWIPIDMSGIPGEVMTAHANSTHLFIGVSLPSKGINDDGAIYRKPLDQLIVGVQENNISDKPGLMKQNYPNPFSVETQINYTLNESGNVELCIYDIMGSKVDCIVNQHQQFGNHQVRFEAASLPKQIYYYTLSINSKLIDSKKMIIR
jgi:photosystem II stability/assembly factor-like uncharacterized protein